MPHRPRRRSLFPLSLSLCAMMIAACAGSGSRGRESADTVRRATSPGPTEPDASPAQDPPPWYEPIVTGGFALQCDRVTASTRWSLTSMNASQHCALGVDLRASRTKANTDTAWFAIKRVRLLEARDEGGRDLRPAETRDYDERRLTFAPGPSTSFARLGFDPLIGLPESLSILRAEADLVVATVVRTIDLPLTESREWRAVEAAPGLKVMLPRVEFRNAATQADILVRVETSSGDADPETAGPPYLLGVALVLPSGSELGTASLGPSEELVEGGTLRAFSGNAPQSAREAADPDLLKLRLRVVTAAEQRTLPFAVSHVPVCSDPAGPVPPPRSERSPYVYLSTQPPGVRVQRIVESQGLVLRQMWVESQVQASAEPGARKVSRSVKITASVDDLIKERAYGAVTRLVLTEVRDESGQDLLDIALQTQDPYSGPRGYVLPSPIRQSPQGNLQWELRGPARLPRLLTSIKGYVEVMVAGPEQSVDIPLGDGDEPADGVDAALLPLERWPSIKAAARFVRRDRGQKSAEVTYTRPMPPPSEPVPGTGGWRRSAEPSEAGPPFVVRVELLAPDGTILSTHTPSESLERAGTQVRSTIRIFGKPDAEGKVRLWVVDQLTPLRIDFQHREVPVAALRRGG